jgi:hypothetical protein
MTAKEAWEKMKGKCMGFGLGRCICETLPGEHRPCTFDACPLLKPVEVKDGPG